MSERESSESAIMRRIQVAATANDFVRLFRNNVGVGWQGRRDFIRGYGWVVADAHPVKFGLCEGSSDLIGWRSIVVTPEMVGRRLAVFTALEVKSATGRATTPQHNFLYRVREAGGIGAIVRSEDEAARVIAETGDQ